jgi:hypothetical protein
MNFTFKTEHPTGTYRSFYPDRHVIKLNKKEVGRINEKSFQIRLAVEKEDPSKSDNPNCSWRWVSLKKEFVSLNEAKEFLKNNYSAIVEKFKLHYFE